MTARTIRPRRTTGSEACTAHEAQEGRTMRDRNGTPWLGRLCVVLAGLSAAQAGARAAAHPPPRPCVCSRRSMKTHESLPTLLAITDAPDIVLRTHASGYIHL